MPIVWFFIILLSSLSCKQNSHELDLQGQPTLATQSQVEPQSFSLVEFSFNEEDQYVSQDLGLLQAKYEAEDRTLSVEQALAAIDQYPNREALIQLGADFLYLDSAGAWMSYMRKSKLEEACYPYLLPSSMEFLIFLNPDQLIGEFLDFSPSVELVGAGSFCMDGAGDLYLVDNNSLYGLEVPTQFNWIVFLSMNGYKFPQEEGLHAVEGILTKVMGFILGKSKSKQTPQEFHIGEPIVSRAAPKTDAYSRAIARWQTSEKMVVKPSENTLFNRAIASKPEPSLTNIALALKGKDGIYNPQIGNRAPVEMSGLTTSALKDQPLLGRGGFGDVYKIQLGEKEYAVKVLRFNEKKMTRDSYDADVMNEIRYSDLSNENPTGIGFYGAKRLEDGRVALVYELQRGDLDREAVKLYGRGSSFNQAKFWKDSQNLATGLQWYHQRGYVFRDWKSENLFVDLTGNVRIGDYGGLRKIDEQLLHSHRGSYTEIFVSPWRELQIRKTRIIRNLAELEKSNHKSPKIKQWKTQLNTIQEQLGVYTNGTSARQLMIRDDIFSFTASLLEQRTGKKIGTVNEFDEQYLLYDQLSGKAWEDHLTSVLKDSGLSHEEYLFFMRGLNMNPSSNTLSFKSMDEVLDHLETLQVK